MDSYGVISLGHDRYLSIPGLAIYMSAVLLIVLWSLKIQRRWLMFTVATAGLTIFNAFWFYTGLAFLVDM